VRRAEKILVVASPVGVFVLWEILAHLGWIDVRVLPPPSAVAITMVVMFGEEGLLDHTAATLFRFFIGMAVGVVPGVLIGLTMGIFRWFRAFTNPLVALFYPIPRIALFPLVLILVGINETSNIVMIALGPFFTMLISAMYSVLNIDRIYRDVAENFATGPRHLYTMVTLPAAMPTLMGGLRISIGLGLLGTVAVEFLVGESGLGHVIWNSWQVLSLQRSMAGLVVSAVVGFAVYLSMDLLERHLVPWQRKSATV